MYNNFHMLCETLYSRAFGVYLIIRSPDKRFCSWGWAWGFVPYVIPTEHSFRVNTLDLCLIYVGNLGSWKWNKRSKTHAEKFIKLLECGREHPEKIENVNGVRVYFSLEFCIRMGSDGIRVYVGLAEDGSEMAVKRLPRDECAHLAEQEKKVLNKRNIIQSNHVVKYWFLDEVSNEDWVYLITDLYEKDLKEFIESSCDISSEIARDVVQDVMEGLADLHRDPEPVLHRDLKPSNIVRHVNGKWLVVNFSMARVLTKDAGTFRSKECGTKDWRATESCSSNNVLNDGDVRYKKESDIQVSFY